MPSGLCFMSSSRVSAELCCRCMGLQAREADSLQKEVRMFRLCMLRHQIEQCKCMLSCITMCCFRVQIEEHNLDAATIFGLRIAR